MIIVYTPHITKRIEYTFDLVFHHILGGEIHITSDMEGFISSEGIKINYSKEPVKGSIHFCSSDFLFKRSIEPIEVDVKSWNSIPTLFPVETGVLPFDPFAACFYLVSRYEEYINESKDHYNRFLPEESIAYKEGFLSKPVVDIWALHVAEVIKQNSNFSFPSRTYKYINTIDVDNAYAYLEKGFVRTSGAIIRSLLRGEFTDLKARISCLLRKEKDPFDTFDELLAIQKEHNLSSIYFFLVADYGLNDKNVPVTSRKFQSLIKGIGDYCEIGIHPSFGSNEEPEKFHIETKRLFNVVHKDITKSRQHFLKLSFPHTYRNLIDQGITDDYTMGYASELGFRAGTCTPFYFYDLEREETTPLKVHPFHVMEATLRHYQNIDPTAAMKHIKPIIDEIKKVNGTFVSLWHNDSLSELGDWRGWKGLYELMIQEAIPESN